MRETWARWTKRTGTVATMRRPKPKKPCVPTVYARVCADHKLVTLSDGHACQSEDCERCAEGYDGKTTSGNTAKARAARIWGRVRSSAAGRPLQQTVFTVPPGEIRRAYYRDPELFFDDCEQMVRYLANSWGLECAAWTAHPCGEDSEDFAPHLHILWWGPSFGYFGHKSKPESKACLEAARKEWGEIVGIEQGEENAHHSFVPWEEMGKWRHRIAYAFRPFPGWGQWRGATVRWHNRPKRDEETETEYADEWREYVIENGFSSTHCPICKKKMVELGSNVSAVKRAPGYWVVRYLGEWIAATHTEP